MIAAPSPDVLNSALAPVVELRGEHSELESSVRESFAAVEALHDELSEWQRELARQQAEFDQRIAAEADAESQLAVAQAELQMLRKQTEDLAISLETERERSVDERRIWADELRDMRRLLELHSEMLTSLGAESTADGGSDAAGNSDAASGAADQERSAAPRRPRRRTA
jgi:chromosome segregation ATPase